MQNKKALRGYKRTKDVEVLIEMKDRTGDYDGVIRLLLKHKRITDALRYAAQYESRNISISKCYQVSVMANQYAKNNCKPDLIKNEKSAEIIEIVKKYLPSVDQISYFMVAKMYEEACKVLVSEGKFEEVYRVYRAQGWFDEGIQLAKKRKDREDEAIFIMLKASEEISAGETLSQDTRNNLKGKMGHHSDTAVNITLIYGMALQNHGMIKQALEYYIKVKNPIGHLEAFNIATEKVEYEEESNRWINIHLEKTQDLH